MLRFWNRLRPYFWSPEHNTEGDAEGQRTLSGADLARWTAYDEVEAASCMRILVDSGFLTRLGSAERPCRVVLLQGHRDVRGPRQREILDALDEWAGPEGEVVGTKAFFRDRIGADKDAIDRLVQHGAIRAIWAEEGTQYRQVQDRPVLDETRLRTIARRQVDRVEAARGYLYSSGCRREYLLRYFGDTFVAEADPTACCDRCTLGQGRRA